MAPSWMQKSTKAGSAEWRQAAAVALRNTSRVTASQVEETLSRAIAKYKCVQCASPPSLHPYHARARGCARSPLLVLWPAELTCHFVCGRSFSRAIVQPGEAVGAVGAHSLGEPATQVCLVAARVTTWPGSTLTTLSACLSRRVRAR